MVAVVTKEMDGANITQTTARLSIDTSAAHRGASQHDMADTQKHMSQARKMERCVCCVRLPDEIDEAARADERRRGKKSRKNVLARAARARRAVAVATAFNDTA